MSDFVPTDAMKVAAAKNDWGKTFTLGTGENAIEVEIKDLTYFDYIEFVSLAKPLVTLAANGLDYVTENGEMNLQFNPSGLDFDAIIKTCGKELPKLAHLVVKQSHPKIKMEEVAILAHRPQRLLEVVLLQVLHNNMIQEFGSFFQRLTGMVTAMVPDMAKAAQPSEIDTTSMTEETLLS